MLSDLPIRIGVMILVYDENARLLLGVRKGSTGAGLLAFPGGAIEIGETYEEAAARELLEETGLIVTESSIYNYASPLYQTDSVQWMSIVVNVKVNNLQDLRVVEPDKCEYWKFFPQDYPFHKIGVFQPTLDLMKRKENKIWLSERSL